MTSGSDKEPAISSYLTSSKEKRDLFRHYRIGPERANKCLYGRNFSRFIIKSTQCLSYSRNGETSKKKKKEKETKRNTNSLDLFHCSLTEWKEQENHFFPRSLFLLTKYLARFELTCRHNFDKSMGRLNIFYGEKDMTCVSIADANQCRRKAAAGGVLVELAYRLSAAVLLHQHQ